MILNISLGVMLVVGLLALATAVSALVIERQHPPAGRLVEVDGGRLHVLELGAENGGVPIVLLHGASGNLQDMRLGLGERLARNHRVILIDRPGHGWSARFGGDEDASPLRQAALIAQTLDALGVTRAIVIGHSFAGAIVTAFALDFPERAAALVLLAPVTHPWPGGIVWFYTLASAPVIGPLFARTIVLPMAFPLLRTLLRAAADAAGLRAPFRTSAAAAACGVRGECARCRAAEGECDAPVAALRRDQGADRHHHRRPRHHRVAGHPLAATLPHARLIVLPGVGHAVQHIAADLVIAETERLAQSAAQ